MSCYAYLLSIFSLASAALITLACGISNTHRTDLRPIQSITLSPASADARDYPEGKVPFVATGHYSSPPTTLTPLPANWAAESVQIVNGIETVGPANGAVSVEANGVAQCAASSSGMYLVVAWDIQDPTLPISCACITFFGEPCCNSVQGTAQLTCP
jgi:hypothetical protein